MRLAKDVDADAITACLRTAPHLAMFPLNYLARDGFAGQGDRRMVFWINEKGPITDVMAVSSAGIVTPFLPNMPILGAVKALKGLPISGIIGPTHQTRSLQHQLGLDDAPVTLDHDEPQYTLDLDDLVVPEGDGTLCPLQDAPRSVMLAWMTQYQTEALSTPANIAGQRAASGYETALRLDNRRVLIADGAPLAMTAFNAALPDYVQIGGVFTPDLLRGKGHARRAVALHLQEARAQGVQGATLAAANAAAAVAYEAIGFQKIGRWSFVLFDGPQDHG